VLCQFYKIGLNIDYASPNLAEFRIYIDPNNISWLKDDGKNMSLIFVTKIPV
jgi:hypothetical protein